MVTVGMDDISVAVFLPSWDDSFFKKHTWRVFDMIVKSYKKSLLTKLSEWFLKENLKVENIDVILKNLLISIILFWKANSAVKTFYFLLILIWETISNFFVYCFNKMRWKNV